MGFITNLLTLKQRETEENNRVAEAKQNLQRDIMSKFLDAHPNALNQGEINSMVQGLVKNGRLDIPTSRNVTAEGPSLPGARPPTANVPIDMNPPESLFGFDEAKRDVFPLKAPGLKNKDQVIAIKPVRPVTPATPKTPTEPSIDKERNRQRAKTLDTFFTLLSKGEDVPDEMRQAAVVAGEGLGEDMSIFKSKLKPTGKTINVYWEKFKKKLGFRNTKENGDEEDAPQNPYAETYPEAFFEDGKWKVEQNGKKYVIQEH